MSSYKKDPGFRRQPTTWEAKSTRSRLTIMGISVAILSALATISLPYFGLGAALDSSNILSELGPKLSPRASIILPDSTDFAAATVRWAEYQAPTFSAVVEVATERDVQEAIIYANKHDIPFLVTNGKHGDYKTLKNLKKGIQIWHRNLDYVTVSPDGTHATVGGGVKVKQMVSALTAANKRAATRVCDCVGMGGAMLGGGHGWLQGQYGLAADSMVEARLVLANASVVTVSNSSNPDLFWALKGAGHNFGIVTEWKHQIYDVDANKPWIYETLTFTHDKLEDLFVTANAISKTQLPQTIHIALIGIVPDIDPVNPVINWAVLHDGTVASAKSESRPLHDLKPVSSTSGETPYGTMSRFVASSENDPACQTGFTLRRYPIDFKTYNTTALRKAYNLFAKTMSEVDALNFSMLAIEQYSLQGVQAIPSDSTAFPHRADNYLVSPFIAYAPNSVLDETAHRLGQNLRNILLEGTGSSRMDSYVNYAHGDEPLEALYGWEPWRLEKLRRLKREYDPHGKFSFYAPVS